jgi:hypothetical protein
MKRRRNEETKRRRDEETKRRNQSKDFKTERSDKPSDLAKKGKGDY